MIITDEKKEQIKAAADIVAVIGETVLLKKNGKDYFGLCPFHSEKSPSFSVAQDKNMFYCFGCGAGGDVIEYVMKRDSIEFPEAAARLAEQYGIELEGSRVQGFKGSGEKTRNHKPENQEFIPDPASTPAELWQEKASRLVMWAIERLMENPGKISWLEKRGINQDTVREFKLGWNQGENGKDIFRPRKSWGLEPAFRDDGKEKRLWLPVGLIIPLIKPETRNQEPGTVLRIRIRRDSGDPKYYVVPGSGMGCMVLADKHCRAFVVVESELDALLVFQESRQNGIGAVALGSAQKKPDKETYERILSVPVVLNALDYDKAGAEAVKWWKDNVRSAVRWPVPAGKDPGDAFENHGIDIGEWIRAGLPEAWSWVKKGSRIRGFKGSSEYQKPETRNQEPSSTVGRSSSCLQNEGAACPENSLPEESPLVEFVRIVKTSPVSVHASAEGIRIEEPKGWAGRYWDTAARLSELVMFNTAVRARILERSPIVINRNNVGEVVGA